MYIRNEAMFARRLFFYLALFLSICLAFGIGYIAYPLLNPQSKPAIAATDAHPSNDPVNMQVYWEAWYILTRDFYGAKPDTNKLVYGAIQGMTGAFGDPYTAFFEPSATEIGNSSLAGRSGDIGLRIERTEHGYLLHPDLDEPAANAGVQNNDLLLLIDDKEVTENMTEDEVKALLLGKVGSEVVLVVRRVRSAPDNAVQLTFRMVRKEYEKPSMDWQIMADDAGAPPIGYIRQTLFSSRSPNEMHTALKELMAAGATRFIWDLRNNPGGFVNESVQLADIWLDGGVILIERHTDGSEKSFEATAGDETGKAPLVVIVDGGSASASEIVAGALQDHGRAKLVGQKTYGKGSVQLVYELSDHSSLHVTNAQWFTPKHAQISGQGLTPDVTLAQGEDPLPTAIALLRK